MNTPPITVTEGIPIIEITAIFSEKKINRVPVVDKLGKLIGIISRADILQSFPFS
jgi:CBS domain-containing protein